MFNIKELNTSKQFIQNNFNFVLNPNLEFTDLKFQDKLLIKKISFNDSFDKSFKDELLEIAPNIRNDYFGSLLNQTIFQIKYKKKKKKLEFFANFKLIKNKSFLNIHFNITFLNNEIVIENINTSSSKIFWGIKAIFDFSNKVELNKNYLQELPQKRVIFLEGQQGLEITTNKKTIICQSTLNEIAYKENKLTFNVPTLNMNKKNIRNWLVKANNKNYNTIKLKFK